jgi:hypothetical protein
MRTKSLWAALAALPLLVATLVQAKAPLPCRATGATVPTAGDPGRSECCQQERGDGPKRKVKSEAPEVDPDRQIVFKVEGLACPAVKGIGCGHVLRGVLISVGKIAGVEASAANYTGTLIRISVTPAADRNGVTEAVRKALTQEGHSAVPLTSVELKRALDREQWRDADRIGELTAIEFHTMALHRVKNFAKSEKLDKPTSDKLVKVLEQQWERISKEAQEDGATQPEDWVNRCRKFLPVLLEQAKEVLTTEQMERFQQALTGQCREEDRPEAPPAPARGEKSP